MVSIKISRGKFPLPGPGTSALRMLLRSTAVKVSVLNTAYSTVYACARLSISSHFFSHTLQSDHSLPRALGFILCTACGSVVLLHAARVFDYFVVIEIDFMDNQAQITETISRLDSEKVS